MHTHLGPSVARFSAPDLRDSISGRAIPPSGASLTLTCHPLPHQWTLDLLKSDDPSHGLPRDRLHCTLTLAWTALPGKQIESGKQVEAGEQVESGQQVESGKQAAAPDPSTDLKPAALDPSAAADPSALSILPRFESFLARAGPDARGGPDAVQSSTLNPACEPDALAAVQSTPGAVSASAAEVGARSGGAQEMQAWHIMVMLSFAVAVFAIVLHAFWKSGATSAASLPLSEQQTSEFRTNKAGHRCWRWHALRSAL